MLEINSLDELFSPITFTSSRFIICINKVVEFKNQVKIVFKNEAKRIFGVKLVDGTVVTVRCNPHDEWDEEKALLAVFAKWLCGNSGNFNKLFDLLDNVVDTSPKNLLKDLEKKGE